MVESKSPATHDPDEPPRDDRSPSGDASASDRAVDTDKLPWPPGTVVAPVVRLSLGRASESKPDLTGGRWVPHASSLEAQRPFVSSPSPTAPPTEGAAGATLLVDPLNLQSPGGNWEPRRPEVQTMGPRPSRISDSGGLDESTRGADGDPTDSITMIAAVALPGRVVPSVSVSVIQRPPGISGASRFRTGAATLIGVQPPNVPSGASAVLAPSPPADDPRIASSAEPSGPPGLRTPAERRSDWETIPAERRGGTVRAEVAPRPEPAGAIVPAGPRGLRVDGPIQLAAASVDAGPARRTPAKPFAQDSGLNMGRRPIVTTLAEIQSNPSRPRLAMVDAPESARAESFRLLRHRLSSEKSRLIAFATPSGGDEAAACGAELALAYAEASSDPVLLLEADSQQPRLSAVLGIAVEYCFALQLCDKHEGSPEPWRAVAVHHAHLHVMAVSSSLSSGDRLAPGVFHEGLFDLVRAPYAQIIVVSPRVLYSADVALITGVVEGVILAGTGGRTTARELRGAAQHLAPTKVLGVTLLEPS
jgi:Mrp family chromosome partitioning ATPase